MGNVSILRGTPNRWKEFQQRYIRLISEALMLLRKCDDLKQDEPTLNRLLYRCIVDANHSLNLDFIPSFEAKNPPHSEDKRRTKRENNIPDFSWPLMDHTASDGNYDRNFALECKRLGQKTSKNWILTEEYITEGILRFFLEEKGYGKGCETGAMVGYVQDMEFDAILIEVNSNISKYKPSIPLLAMPASGWQPQAVNSLAHTFQRSYIPTTFSLQHFWVDMRDCYFPSVATEDASLEHEDLIPDGSRKRKSQNRPRSKKPALTRPQQIALPIDQG